MREDDPFDLFIAATHIRYCYYSETFKILGSTFGMCVLQVRRRRRRRRRRRGGGEDNEVKHTCILHLYLYSCVCIRAHTHTCTHTHTHVRHTHTHTPSLSLSLPLSLSAQDFEALTPNLLARTVETVEGGGVIVILLRTMTSLRQLYTMTMDVHMRYRTETHQDVVGRFNER